jgi:hypothetical protein
MKAGVAEGTITLMMSPVSSGRLDWCCITEILWVTFRRQVNGAELPQARALLPRVE